MRKLLYISLILCLALRGYGQQSDQKNILFIAVDDLKPLLSVYGHDQMHTHNFERLAAMGTTFTNAHVQYAVCGPSRASIMTGTFPDETKVWDLHTDFRESAPDLQSMPEYLITQGYESTAIGKIYHKGSSAKGHDGKSWSIPHQMPDNYPAVYGEPAFSYYQNPETKARMTALMQEGQDKGMKGNGKLRNYVFKQLKPSTESADVPDAAYQDGLYTLAAIDQLEQLKDGDKPFFLAVGYQKPHLPFVAPQRYWDMYERSEIDLASFQELSEGTPKIAYHSFGELRAYSDIGNDLRAGDVLPEDKQRELIHGYMACVSYIDAQLGMLLDALEKKELMDNTVIVLWGDHGFHLGDHTLWCKHSNFEQATHVPLMFAGPGVEAGQKVSQPVNLVDVFPTLFELSNTTPSPQATGKSLVPLMDGNEKTTIAQDYAISQYRRNKNNTMGYTLRTDRYRYTEWIEEFLSFQPYGDSKVSGVELYDYEVDPNETRNLAGDPAYAKVVMEMQAKLIAHLGQQEQDLK